MQDHRNLGHVASPAEVASLASLVARKLASPLYLLALRNRASSRRQLPARQRNTPPPGWRIVAGRLASRVGGASPVASPQAGIFSASHLANSVARKPARCSRIATLRATATLTH